MGNLKKEELGMKKKNIALCIFIVFAVSGYAYFKHKYPSYTINYKLTISVDTPEGIKTGSTVRQISEHKALTAIDLPDVGRAPDVIGEAVVVDLGKQGLLFGLISNRSYREFLEAFPATNVKQSGGRIRYYKTLPLGSKAVVKKNRPTLVYFKDADDPKTLERLVYGDLSKSFGEGVKTLDVTVEITNKPITRGIEKYLPEKYSQVITERWRDLSLDDRKRLSGLIGFKQGERK